MLTSAPACISTQEAVAETLVECYSHRFLHQAWPLCHFLDFSSSLLGTVSCSRLSVRFLKEHTLILRAMPPVAKKVPVSSKSMAAITSDAKEYGSARREVMTRKDRFLENYKGDV